MGGRAHASASEAEAPPPASQEETEAAPGSAGAARAAADACGVPQLLSLAAGGFLLVVVVGALYVGRIIFLPLAVALLLSFVLRPVSHRLARWGTPAPARAVLLVGALGGAVGYGVYSLQSPAAEWLEQAPRSLHQLQYRITEIKAAVADVQETTAEVEELGRMDDGGQAEDEVVLKKDGLDDQLLAKTQGAVSGALLTFAILFFLLGWGGQLFRNFINSLPRFHNQRRAVLMVNDISASISAYLGTITAINLALGVTVSGVMWLLEMPNPVLWGIIAALLNYMPYLGPAVTTAVLAFAALMTFPSAGEALVVPAAFLAVTAVEGTFITPLVVGSRLTLNPLLIFLSLMFWFWLWGIIGALLTVPILVCTKVVLDRLEATQPLARMMD